MKVMHIWPEPPRAGGGALELGGVVELPRAAGKRLWHRMPGADAADATHTHDHLLLAVLFPGMRCADSIRVHGAVSASRLENLEEFTRAWHCWRPDVYRVPEIHAEATYDLPIRKADRAVCAFSGGVDASCLLRRHTRREAGRRTRNICIPALIQGFDIPLAQTDTLRTAFASASAIVKSAGLDLRVIATNSREFSQVWEDSFFAQVVAALSVYGGGCDACVVGSDEPYSDLAMVWGSNPVTNHLLSSREFAVITDGLELRRIAKVGKIAAWPEARRHLRVCWQRGAGGRNCGVCEKCTRTRLEFLCNGIEAPECFGSERLPPEQIRSLRAGNPVQESYLREILDFAEASPELCDASWVQELRVAVRKGANGHRPSLLKRFRNSIERQMLRNRSSSDNGKVAAK